MAAMAETMIAPTSVSALPRCEVAPSSNAATYPRLEILAWLFVGVSIFARVVRFTLCPPLWGDEHMQAAAFLDLGYLDLLGTLPYEQVAPFGFLWIELTFVKLLGFHEWSLRLFPLLAGIGSVLLFHHVSGRLLAGSARLLAVGAFCATYALIRYSCEVKPYGSDAFVSLCLIALLVEWRREPTRVRWLWALAAATPIALGLSFPVVFVGGAISIALLGPVWQARERWTWAAYLTFNLLLSGTFLGLQVLLLSRQYHSSTSFMLPFWIDGFMPIGAPARIPLWLLEMHTGDMFSYPYGGPHFQSVLTSICCGIGLWCCWRHGQRSLMVGFLGMLALALVAAALQRYPYGIHPRVVLYAAGPICLLFGAGAGFLVERIRTASWRHRWVWFLTAAMAIILAAPIVRDIRKPFRYVQEVEHRDFARRLWTGAAEADLMCVRGERFYQKNDDSAFLCNWGRFHTSESSTPASDRELRCVVFHSDGAVVDQARLDAWMAQMLEQYHFVGREEHRVPINGDGIIGFYDVYRFKRSASRAP